jgi:hypothetical protein
MMHPRHSSAGLILNKNITTSTNGGGGGTSTAALFVMSPSSSQAQLAPQISVASSTGTDGSKSELCRPLIMAHQQQQLQQQHQYQLLQQQPNSSNLANTIPYSYQVISLNESKAKGECKKRPMDVIW